ncbi:hypothetical protein HDU83_002291 [Entophlyctis luteolus]|nr:hypothetical protein HDU83_002291 [Entophlyctis luteolus]KAJ3381241.1 hypothetical protein HDU84_005261 [Entophlyctis sp. JEL0112]
MVVVLLVLLLLSLVHPGPGAAVGVCAEPSSPSAPDSFQGSNHRSDNAIKDIDNDYDDDDAFVLRLQDQHQQEDTYDDSFPDEDSDLAASLRDAYNPPFLERAATFMQKVVEWVQAHLIIVGSVFAGIILLNVSFVVFVMGYLLKEEHYVIRAIRLSSTSRPAVWRAITDTQSYPLWRRSVKKVSGAADASSLKASFSFNPPSGPSYTVTETSKNCSVLTWRTHPSYEPEQYAQPLVLTGAPIAANINETHKKEYDAKIADAKATDPATDPTSHIPKFRGKNILDLPPAPILLPANVPWRTEMWMFELEDTKDGKGTVVYITYRGTMRSRFLRCFNSLIGFDGKVEKYLSDLACFVGEPGATTVKPEMGALPDLS